MLVGPSDVLSLIVYFQNPTFNFLGHQTNSNKRDRYLVLHDLSLKKFPMTIIKWSMYQIFMRLKHHEGVNLTLLQNGGRYLIFGIIDNSERI
jgi:hypothetical protein